MGAVPFAKWLRHNLRGIFCKRSANMLKFEVIIQSFYYFNFRDQIISPHDKGISKKIEENLFPRASSWDVEILMSSKMVSDPYKEVFESYIQDLSKLCFHRSFNNLKFLWVIENEQIQFNTVILVIIRKSPENVT